MLQTEEEIERIPLPVNKMIEEIQVKLSEDGFYIGSIDGLFAPNIEAAIRVYELEQGLPVSGLPSKALLEYMQRN
jgi:peptidoglycan hydrolase-like protein with peptidoglycan-binding domain